MTSTTTDYVTLVVKYSDINFLVKSLSLVNDSLKNEVQHTINELNRLLTTKEGSNFVRIELKMDTDVKALFGLIKSKSLFDYLTPAEIRHNELWKLVELIIDLPAMHKQQLKAFYVSY